MQKEQKLDFTIRQKQRAVMGFLLPLMLSGGFQYMYAVVNTAVLGRAVSMGAVAVIGACSPFNSLISNLFGGMASGAGFYFSRCVGSGQKGETKQAFSGAVYLLLGMYLPAVLSAICPQPLLSIAGVSKELWGESCGYLRFLLLGSFFVGLKGLLVGLLQGHGDSRVSGFLAAVSVVTQTCFTLLFSGFWEMGAKGSSAAMLVNHLIFCSLLGIYAWKVYGTCSLIPPGEIRPGTWRELGRNMWAKTGLMLLLWLGSFVFLRQVNRLSETVIAANAYVTAIYDVCTEIVFAYGTAALVAVGQNYGSRERYPERYGEMIRYYIRLFLIQGTALASGFLLLFWIGGESLVRWIAGKDASGPLIDTAAMLLRIIGLGYPALAVLLICRCALQSMGRYQVQLVLGGLAVCISFLCACFVPWGGAPVIGICIFLKLLIPGCWAGIAYRICMKKEINGRK